MKSVISINFIKCRYGIEIYKDEKKIHGVYFTLIKEMITSFQRQGYNYYRGQREDWETVPGIFRNLQNSEGNKYCNTLLNLFI